MDKELSKIVARNLKILLAQRGWTLVNLAREANLSLSTVQKIHMGLRPGGLTTLRKLTKVLGTSIEALTSEDNITPNIGDNTKNDTNLPCKLEVAQIPIYGSIPCGYPDIREQNILGYAPVIKEELKLVSDISIIFGLIAKGDSLQADDIHDGDTLFIDPATPFSNGKIYIVRLLNTNEVVARHVYIQNGNVRLASSNGEYKDINSAERELLGRVILSTKMKRH